MTGTREFEELRISFEAYLKTIYVGKKVERVGRSDGSQAEYKGEFYTNGEINKMFLAFIAGWSAGKSWERFEG